MQWVMGTNIGTQVTLADWVGVGTEMDTFVLVIDRYLHVNVPNIVDQDAFQLEASREL